MGRKAELMGLKFNKLTVIKFAYIKSGNLVWECVCECGNTTFVTSRNITSGKTKSCGCLVAEMMRKATTTHGMTGGKFYMAWKQLKNRCNNINIRSYKDYGGRGIKYQESWKTFINFKDDMYESYLQHIEEFGEKETSIDRKDVNGNYCKENCRWQTNLEQGNNKTNNRIIEYNGGKMTLADTARKYNMSYDLLSGRMLSDLWSLEDAITTPKIPHGYRRNVVGGSKCIQNYN